MKCYKVCALVTKDLPIYKLFKTILDRLFYLSIYGFNCGSTSAGMTFGRSALQSILLFGTAIRNRSHEAIWDQSLCQYLLLLLYEWRNSSLNKWNGECEYDSVYSIYFPSIFSSATGSLHVLHAFRYRLDSVKWSAPRSELKNHRKKPNAISPYRVRSHLFNHIQSAMSGATHHSAPCSSLRLWNAAKFNSKCTNAGRWTIRDVGKKWWRPAVIN